MTTNAKSDMALSPTIFIYMLQVYAKCHACIIKRTNHTHIGWVNKLISYIAFVMVIL